jgi:hypothetical protein
LHAGKHKMKESGETVLTIDERLDRLTERHEALTQSLELTRLQQAEDAQNIRQLARIAATTSESVTKLANSIGALLHISESHERRITHIEGGEA